MEPRGVIAFASRSHVGRVRSNNEDAVAVIETAGGLHLALVADGVGGNAAGEIASGIAVSEFEDLARSGKLDPCADASLRAPLLDMATRRVHGAIAEAARVDDARRGMACTLTAVLLVPSADAVEAALVQVGDSRAYRLRSGTLVQLTTDQTVAQALVDEGRLDAADVARHPDRGTLTQCLGLEAPEAPLEPVIESLTLAPGDRLLLCSDGLSDLVPDDAIAALLSFRDLEATADALIEAALDAGGQDNVSVVVVELAGGGAS